MKDETDPADVAWQLYLDRGVILPGYAGEIVERRSALRS